MYEGCAIEWFEASALEYFYYIVAGIFDTYFLTEILIDQIAIFIRIMRQRMILLILFIITSLNTLTYIHF